MNPINPLLIFLFSPAEQVAWGVVFKAPDDDHPEPWVYDFVSAAWPADARVGPQHPSNLPDFDPMKLYQAVFDGDSMSWEEIEIPPLGLSEEESENGSS